MTVIPTTHRVLRDRIEAAIAGAPPMNRYALGIDGGEHRRREAAGFLAKTFAPELDRLIASERAMADTMARVRKVIRQYPEDGDVPVRRILAALYGDEKP
jgi:hypothetical protein